MRGYHSCGDFGVRPKSYRPFPSSAFPQTVSNKLAPGGENPPGAFLSHRECALNSRPVQGQRPTMCRKFFENFTSQFPDIRTVSDGNITPESTNFSPNNFPPNKFPRATAKEVTGNTVENGVGTVTWTITATKDSSGAPTFTVHGGLTVTNSGTAPATIGNIVVNLQKPNSPKQGSNAPYVSIAADVADATSGDTATSAKIVAAGSQENPATNAAWGTGNYTVSGAQGTFTETAGKSGALEFKDASN